jgi:protein-disulfide isomerase
MNRHLKHETTLLTRRAIITTIGLGPLAGRAALAGSNDQIHTDDGAGVEYFKIPSELDPATLPGIIWKNGSSGEVLLYEFFDYNCAYCRKAARDVQEISDADHGVRLGLVNNAILSVGSVQAAKVQQGVLRLFGPEKALAFHERMFSKRGKSDGASALAVAREMGLDAKKVEESADSEAVTDVLRRQARLAADLGMSMTPSFIVAGVGLLGWPGRKAVESLISNAKLCDNPVCPPKP